MVQQLSTEDLEEILTLRLSKGALPRTSVELGFPAWSPISKDSEITNGNYLLDQVMTLFKQEIIRIMLASPLGPLTGEF